MSRRVFGVALAAMLFTSLVSPAALANSASSKKRDVEVTSPRHLSSVEASYDAAAGLFGATVQLSADINGYGPGANVAWVSTDEGFLGIGESITATLHIRSYDSAQPRIVALIFENSHLVGSDHVQVSIWRPSPKCLTHSHWHWHGLVRHRHSHDHCERPVNDGHHDPRPPRGWRGPRAI